MPDWLRPTDICVVTGGCNGLGAALLKALATAGCQTVALDVAIPDNEVEENETTSINESSMKPSFSAPPESSAGTEVNKTVESSSKPTVDLNDGSSQEKDSSAKNNITTATPPSIHVTNKATSEPSEQTTSDTRENNESPTDHFEASETSENTLRPSLVIKCDVRSQEDLATAQEQIFEKFKRYPTVLICNAGVRHPLNSIASTEFEDIEETIEVNLSGPLKCMRTFLPKILEAKRGFVITIGSALGLICPKGLSVYGASKAGILGFHEALEQEIASYKDVHALLVCPGQIDTSMFADIKTPSEQFAPIIDPEKLAQKIVKRIKKAKTSTVYSPAYVRYLSLVRAVPTPIASLARKWSGVDKVYDDIIAQRQKEALAETAAATTNGINSTESIPGLKKSGIPADEVIADSKEQQETEQQEKEQQEKEDVKPEEDRKSCLSSMCDNRKHTSAEPTNGITSSKSSKASLPRWFKTNIFQTDANRAAHHQNDESAVSPFDLNINKAGPTTGITLSYHDNSLTSLNDDSQSKSVRSHSSSNYDSNGSAGGNASGDIGAEVCISGN